MGNGCSIFGSPEHCSQCKTKELHACKWRVTYENAFITREAEKNNFFRWGDIFEFAKHKKAKSFIWNNIFVINVILDLSLIDYLKNGVMILIFWKKVGNIYHYLK